MMEYMNVLRAGERTAHRDEVEPLVQLVAPFAPHIAEELWEHFGHEGSVFDSRWPSYDEALATVDEIELVVQVNGKVRGKINAPRDIAQDAAMALARADAGNRALPERRAEEDRLRAGATAQHRGVVGTAR